MPLNLPSLTLFKPPESISTPEVYKALRLEHCSCQDPEKLLENFYAQRFCFVNDLEEPAFRLLPILHQYKELLAKQCAFAAMTGSGTAFFGLNNQVKHIFPNNLKTPYAFINRQPLAWYYFSVFR